MHLTFPVSSTKQMQPSPHSAITSPALLILQVYPASVLHITLQPSDPSSAFCASGSDSSLFLTNYKYVYGLNWHTQ